MDDYILNKIEYISGNKDILLNMSNVKCRRIFDVEIITFLDDLSKELMKKSNIRDYPDLLALAFWLRKSNLKSYEKKYEYLDNNIGKGLVFHIAPGNMALSFAYSLATGLISGNCNIIRLASREFNQANIFIESLNSCLISNQTIMERVCIIKYPHDLEITKYLSLMANVRIIWGGDNTIEEIRQAKIGPRCTEITFSNRFSISIINADSYIENFNKKKTAHDFYIDSYLTDQNACSSPRILFWMGERREEAKNIFYKNLADEIKSYHMADVALVDKLVLFSKFAAYNNCKLKLVDDYKILRIIMEKNDHIDFESIISNIGNSGFFYEIDIDSIEEIKDLCNIKLQTISYIGIDPIKIKDFIIDNGLLGADRIVPVGKTLDFDFYWDGKDIISEMSRRVVFY